MIDPRMHRRRMLQLAGAGGLAYATGARGAVTEADLFPVVETAQGLLRGVTAQGVSMFKGVRYGADTSGPNRFMPPAPPPKWSGIRTAYAYGQIAPQMPNGNADIYGGLIMFDIQPGGMGEDCLVANVWTPTPKRGARLPVLVHIHGGGFYGGSGNSPGFDGEEMARFGKCVVITINHRLGAFGFLDLADQDPAFARSGAVGMMDVVAALRWVRENVDGFGGDPNRVLVYGQSGGGAKTSVLMAMPAAKGLFHRAGVMSGATLRVLDHSLAQQRTHALMDKLGLRPGQVRALQRLPFETVLTAQADMEAADRAKGEAPRSFGPVLDGVAIPRHPFDPDAPAVSFEVPMIISNVLDERAYRMHDFNLDEAGFHAWVAGRVGEARAAEVAAMYRRDDPKATPFVLKARFDTDETFRKPSIIEAERKAAQTAQGGAPVWRYLWRQPTPQYSGRFGTPHGSDVGPSLHDVRGGLNGSDPATIKLTDQLSSAWVNFAATGDPNNALIPHWPAYKVPERATMVWGSDAAGTGAHVENDPRGEFRRFWEKEGPKPAG